MEPKGAASTDPSSTDPSSARRPSHAPDVPSKEQPASQLEEAGEQRLQAILAKLSAEEREFVRELAGRRRLAVYPTRAAQPRAKLEILELRRKDNRRRKRVSWTVRRERVDPDQKEGDIAGVAEDSPGFAERRRAAAFFVEHHCLHRDEDRPELRAERAWFRRAHKEYLRNAFRTGENLLEQAFLLPVLRLNLEEMALALPILYSARLLLSGLATAVLLKLVKLTFRLEEGVAVDEYEALAFHHEVATRLRGRQRIMREGEEGQAWRLEELQELNWLNSPHNPLRRDFALAETSFWTYEVECQLVRAYVATRSQLAMRQAMEQVPNSHLLRREWSVAHRFVLILRSMLRRLKGHPRMRRLAEDQVLRLLTCPEAEQARVHLAQMYLHVKTGVPQQLLDSAVFHLSKCLADWAHFGEAHVKLEDTLSYL